MGTDDLQVIINRIANKQHTEEDITLLQRLVTDNPQIALQIGKNIVNIGEGKEIHIGDRIYYQWNEDAINALIIQAKSELHEDIGIVLKPPIPSNYNEQTWVGREAVVSDILSKLQEKTRLLWITGISGIGKTALGECLVSKSWEHDPSFQWIYLEILEGQSPDFVSVAADLLAKLGVPELDPQERNNPEQLAKRLLQKFQSYPYWIQIDSLERLLNPEEPTKFIDVYWVTFLQRFLTESHVVSRLVLTAQAFPTALVEFSERYPNYWHEITLRGLSADEYNNEHLELFSKNDITINESNQLILSRIGKIYEGHPLVLQVIAKEILALPFNGNMTTYWQRYGNEFEQVTRELQTEQVNPALHSKALKRQVRQRVEISLKRLPTDALDLLCRSSVYRRAVPETFWLAMISDDHSSTQQEEAYEALSDRALVEKEGVDQGQFLIRLHNLIRSVAYDILKADTTTWETTERQAAHLWLTAYKSASDAPKLETVRGYLEAFAHYCEIEDWESAKDILETPLNTSKESKLLWEIGIWGYYREQVYLCERILDKLEQKTNVTFLNILGVAYKNLGDPQKSVTYYERSLNIAQQINDKRLEMVARNNLANLYRGLGKIHKAMKLLEEALELSQEIADQSLEGMLLGNLGIIYKDIGQYQKAINFQTRYLAIAQETKDKRCEAIATGDLALIYAHLNEHQKAINYYEKQLELVAEVYDKQVECVARCNMALTYYELNDYQQAVKLLEESLSIAENIGFLRGKGNALMYLGGIQIKLNLYEIALKNLESSLKIFREIQARGREAENLEILADLYQAITSYPDAIKNIHDASEIYQLIGFRAGAAKALKKMAELYQTMDELNEAQQYCQQALALATELGIPLAAECEALLQEIEEKNKQSKA